MRRFKRINDSKVVDDFWIRPDGYSYDGVNWFPPGDYAELVKTCEGHIRNKEFIEIGLFKEYVKLCKKVI